MTTPIARDDWPRLLALVDQALQHPEHGRDAWLRSLDLPAPLAGALQGLLDERRAIDSDDFLHGLPALPAGQARPTLGSLAPGMLIGPWRLLRELGQGGMSVVWLAERADGQVARQVALKLPHAGPGNDLLARRLMRERRIMAALEHPHIARLYDVGLSEAGTPYLVMEHVPGAHLLAHADAQRLGLRQRVALFQQVLAAVQHAHGQMVLHRDLKPGNILVGPGDTVKLLDFGIAKLMAGDGTAPDLTELTRAGDRQFTPSHASPEQLRGQPLGTASDVYALGVVLCELLCGQRPYAGQATTPAQLEAAILGEDPRPPSRCTLADAAAQARMLPTAAALARALRGDLDAIVLKALARAPADRYPSAEAFSADLARWQQGLPVQARAPGRTDYASKFVKRHRWAVGLGTAATLALLVAGTVAVLQGRAAREEGERAAMARDYLLQLFEAAAPDRNQGRDLSAIQLLAQGVQKAQAQLGGQPRLQAELLAGIGQIQYHVGDMVGAEAALRQAAALFKAQGDKASEAAALLTQLQVALDEGLAAHVQADLMAALQVLAPVIVTDRLAQLKWQGLRGRDAAIRGSAADARTWLTQAVRNADLDDPTQVAIAFQAQVDLAILAMNQGDGPAARQQLEMAHTLARRPSIVPEAVRSWILTLAQVTLDEEADDMAAVLRLLPSAIDWCGRELGPRNMKCAHLKLRHVSVLTAAGDPVAARDWVQELLPWLQQQQSPLVRKQVALTLARALAIDGHTGANQEPFAALRELVQHGHAETLRPASQMPALITLAEIRLRAGDHAGGQAWLAKAEAMLPQAGAERERAALHLQMGRALALLSLGKDHEALAELGERCTEPAVWSDHVLMQLNCVRSLAATGRKADALALVQRSVPVLARSLGPDAPNTQRARQLLQALQAPGGWKPPPWTPAQIFYAF